MFQSRPHWIVSRSVVVLCFALLVGCSVPKPAPLSPIAAPTNVVAIAGNATVTVTWNATSGAASYNVKRALNNGGPYSLVGSSNSTTYTDSSVVNGTTYYYVVSARDAAGEGADSGQAFATPNAPTAVPPPPANLTATVGDTLINLAWTASTSATAYRVKRAAVSGGPYTQIAAPLLTSYVDTSLNNGTTYYYVVTAINSVGESAASVEVSAAPSPPPPTTFGTWTNVTPTGVGSNSILCGTDVGAYSVQADPANPSHLYAGFNCEGIWKSIDYGNTWTGPINTGTNGVLARDCVGGIYISPTSTANVPTIYQSCFRGTAIGFWKSVDGGVSWTRYVVAPGGIRQDYYPPVVDPYDQNHLIMTAHEFDSIVESVDGGQNWTSVSLANGMLQSGRTGFIYFINTGSPSTTRGTWLWIAEQSGGAIGTWRTTNSGGSWTRVDSNEHLLGAAQIYQPGTNGVVYMAGVYSALNWGVLRSNDYGQTWTHVGLVDTQNLVIGTSKNVYSMGPGTPNPLFEVASQPGTGIWVTPATPSSFTFRPWQMGTVNNGANNILLAAMGNGGVWRYVEP